MTDRNALKHRFIAATPWAAAAQTLLAGDASNRRYDRLINPDGTSAVLMDAPSEKGEDTRPFITIANHLNDIGLSAPKILHQDIENGFLILEDLGDDLFARTLQTHPDAEAELYEAAVDTLVHLHRHDAPPLAAYTTGVMAPLAALCYDWYYFGITGHNNGPVSEKFSTALKNVMTPLEDTTPVLIQRDYHAENLLWLPERAGAARVGLLDFQDAMLGHPAYDLVSVLQDARRDVSPETQNAMITHFLKQTAHDPAEFRTAYAVLGVQRNLRILGVFARLCMRDGKAHYIDLIPRVWDHLQNDLAHPALAEVAKILTASLPPPTPKNLEHLKSQCAQHPNR